MVGRFILGAIFGGVVVTGGLVIGAALFPPQDVAANTNVSPDASATVELAQAETPPPAPEAPPPAEAPTS